MMESNDRECERTEKKQHRNIIQQKRRKKDGNVFEMWKIPRKIYLHSC